MFKCLQQSADFQRVLAAPLRSRSAHFALHHLAEPPLPPKKPSAKGVIPALTTDLSTGVVPTAGLPVDDLAAKAWSGVWLGCVVPKRHAKRAVTRNLIKRQARALFGQHASALPAGQWLVRLRQPFATKLFPSARSDALAAAARAEITALLASAARPRAAAP